VACDASQPKRPPGRPPLVNVPKLSVGSASGSSPYKVPIQSGGASSRRSSSARSSASASGRRIAVDPLIGHGYETISPIANGAFSKVTRCRHLSTKLEVAVKTYNKEKYFQRSNAHLLEALKNELSVLKKLQPEHCPHIANIIDVLETRTAIIAVLEYCSGGSLQRCLQKAGGCDRPHSLGIGEKMSVSIAFQLATALAHIHGAGIAHRDVKPENVLFVDTTKEKVKLCDFGFAIACGNKRVRTVCGSPQYMAPELVSKAKREPFHPWCCDMWAYAALVFEMFEGKPAFRGVSVEQLNMRIIRASHEAFTDATPAAARALIKNCLQVEPASRLHAKDAAAHACFGQQRKAATAQRKASASAAAAADAASSSSAPQPASVTSSHPSYDLDPNQVFSSLPASLQAAFEARDIEALEEALAALPEAEAERHMDRCVASGLWEGARPSGARRRVVAAAAAPAEALH
jgi:serine/threonine protein kinase